MRDRQQFPFEVGRALFTIGIALIVIVAIYFVVKYFLW